ncbi:putative slc9a7 protein [Schistosoma mansoni]|uniref:putative slc9a7 protein n=1 Tax=Schistosoma mansoni TaxID=6183 RepID=UPI0001A62772|nr:putative slc9a7 protein [Schistosoma mansoni]|eukprot:XP_018648808.1 putative slc9a7 protein [Schistosoma mansoni]
MSSSDPYECLVNESKIIEKHTEQRLQNDHRMDNLILLVYVVLLTLSVITIWAFKHRRFRYIHETGLSVVYGLVVGLILRYAIKSASYSVEMHVFPRKNDEACGGHLPPERLIIEFPVRDQYGKFNLSMSFRYKFEQQSDFNSLINNKATFDPEFFFNVLLPPIIFSAGYSMKRGYFFKNIGAVLTYAFGGTLLSALVVGTICYGFTRGITSLSQILHLSDCLLFGAIISATDPVTVLAIFSDLKVDVNLYALVFGESVLNDALAIALAQSIEKYGSISAGNFDGHAFLSSVLNFFIMFGGSFVTGVSIGCVTSLLTKFTHIKEHPLLETALFVLMSYSTFLFAEAVGFTDLCKMLIILFSSFMFSVGVDCNSKNQPHTDTEEDSVDDHSCCSSHWMSFDKLPLCYIVIQCLVPYFMLTNIEADFYLKPLLTHSTPPLTESLPSCCYKFAKFLTTSEQRSETFVSNDGNNSYHNNFKRDSTTVFYSNEKASISSTLSINTVKVQPVELGDGKNFHDPLYFNEVM